ncbi:hypothetical protein D3C73_1010790 [compost metagenome]
MQGQIPVTLGIVGQLRIAEPGTALERQPENQVHALPGAQAMQRLGQGLHSGAVVLGRAVGGGDQHSGNLRIGADFVFQHRQVEAIGIEAAFDRHLHVGHQRRTVSQFPSTLQKHRQRHARCQRRHFARDFFASVQQQPLQPMGQALHIQGFGQVRGRRQRQGLAHAGTVVATAHQNERHGRIAFALADAAQDIQAIDAGQLPVGDHQVIGVGSQ